MVWFCNVYISFNLLKMVVHFLLIFREKNWQGISLIVPKFAHFLKCAILLKKAEIGFVIALSFLMHRHKKNYSDNDFAQIELNDSNLITSTVNFA
jgi:hypothetical protein